ncbi:RNA-guided endonuclease InsQ/TnpB family protein [Nocardia brevicatena]|uniref:RNA-guided endonuclease InsQ/TnpB family protein n=1 Tax=Nocardia brevicatena TaxID=37327 RepID=UPI0002D9A483|nr:transposase [Nocardia brevicatena]
MKVAWSRELPAEPSSVTTVKDAAGRYFASSVVQVDAEPLPEAGTEVGIDLGLSTFAVLSNGKTITSPRFLRQAERRLKKAQRAVSRKQKGPANRVKALSGSPRLTLAWPICGGTGRTSIPRRLSARTKRCSSRTCA